jgi:hypothetical protein
MRVRKPIRLVARPDTWRLALEQGGESANDAFANPA